MNKQKNEILLAAEDIVLSQGIQKLTMRNLANKAKLHPHAIYQHYENKQQLLKKMATKMTKSLITELNSPNLSPKMQLLKATQVILEKATINPHLIDFVFFNSEIDSLLTKDQISLPNYFLSKINGLINEKTDQKQDTNNLFIQLWANIHGLIMLVKQKVIKYHPNLATNRLNYL